VTQSRKKEMRFTETKLSGAFIVEPEKFEDKRGFFAHSWSKKEFADRGLDSDLVECSISFNHKRGTLRGMHYQAAPHGQVKLVRCTMGAIHDVVIDLRTGSPTFKQWVGIELTAVNRLMLYIPRDFAHGFQTLADETEVFYQMSGVYRPESGRGVRWNDSAFGISWPEEVTMINERDRTCADLKQ
jgi:dTDP-4-dehydrorhamnose 3,5-epimerase